MTSKLLRAVFWLVTLSPGSLCSPLLPVMNISVWSRDSEYENIYEYENYDHYVQSSEQKADPLASLRSRLKMDKPIFRGKPVDKERFKKGQ